MYSYEDRIRAPMQRPDLPADGCGREAKKKGEGLRDRGSDPQSASAALLCGARSKLGFGKRNQRFDN